MEDYIQIEKYPVKEMLDVLLLDRTTGNNIIFATDSYEAEFGSQYSATSSITPELITGESSFRVIPRVLKAQETQSDRTRNKGEVFTPACICNKMNNHCDEEWFGRKDVFNREEGNTWTTNEEPVLFPEERPWQEYVVSKRIEITCGEAPYLVSRYDAATGEPIAIDKRVGILDRKLRIVNENTESKEDWIEWTIKAYQNSYGYEFQGDSLLIARINLLDTFAEYYRKRWKKRPLKSELKQIAGIISWNIWQMDGLTGMVPLLLKEAEFKQVTFFDILNENCEVIKEPIPAKTFDWKQNTPIVFNEIKKGR